MSSPEVQRGIVYSVQDERLDPLKGKSSSVYIVESDNDFFFFGVLFKQINNSVTPFRFFFLYCCCCAEALCAGLMYVCV